MVHDHVPFQNLAFPPLGQLVKDLPKVVSQLLVQLLAPTLGNEHDIVFAFPFRMI